MRDALIGDLNEEFARRPSAAWFWRQVLMAVATSFRRTARREKGIIIAAGWSAAFCLVSVDLFRSLLRSEISAPGFIAYPWPWSMLCGVAVGVAVYSVSMIAGLAACLVANGEFRFIGFCVGCAAATATLIAGDLFVTLIGPSYPIKAEWSAPYAALLFASLLVAILAARKSGPAQTQQEESSTRP
jgi:hypothetical protein